MSFASLLAGQLRQGGGFLLGTPGELVALFGWPLPELPEGDVDADDVERIAVETSPPLREACARWIEAAARGIQAGGAATTIAPSEAAEEEYLRLLAESCRTVLFADRRQGLYNLFWLAHSREIAEVLERLFAAAPADRRPLRYQIHPLLSGLLRRADELARTGLGKSQRILLDFRHGAAQSDALVRCLVDDQLPLTEINPRAFDPEHVLIPENRRFRITAVAFGEILATLRERLLRGQAAGERGLCRVLRAAAPGSDAAAGDPRVLERLVYADTVRDYLLQDYEGTAAALLKNRTLKGERPRDTSWSELLAEFSEVTRCVRRAEAVDAARRALDFTLRSRDSTTTRERFLEGRLFRLSSTGAVQSAVRTATILFADIRGFTRASEGLVSEGELARELYDVFDPAALVVQRFGGTIDKYLGDGFMATFAGGLNAGDETLAAVRCAVALQQVLGSLRRLRRTDFRMGISLHTGRVAVARFLRDEQSVDTTVIGRQMNIAGRLSSSGEDAGVSESGESGILNVVGGVSVDDAGGLVNRGIAVSGNLFDAFRAQVPLEGFREDGVDAYRWYDRQLCLWLHFGYVGEARFRGIEATVPVWSLVPAPAGAG